MAGTPLLLPSRLLPHSHRDMPTSRTGDLRLDAFFTTAPAGLAILDRELRYVQLNDTLALMNGRPVADHVGKSVREVLPAIAATLEPLLQRILDTGEPVLNIELSGETPAQPGVTRYWRASYFPLAARGRRGKNGAGGIGAIVVEDTPRRHAERALRRSGADYRAIVEQATHGIYRSSLEGRFLKVNPALVTMLGYDSEAQVLALELDRDVDVEPGERARRGSGLVHRLLGFGRHELLAVGPLSAHEWVREELHTVRRLLPATVEIQCDAEPEAGVVEADAGALEQILLNLATNARDAMPGGGTLYLDVRRTRLDAEDRPLHAWVEPGSYVCIAVSDTGAGMDAETQARVFEPFFTTKPAGVGTGLGMAMVYGLVKQHKGFVHMYSEVGQGTTVKLYLPLALEHPVPGDARAAGQPETLPGGTEAILLVEDDLHLRTVAQRLFEKVGYRVFAAADGAEGLASYRARARELDLVITDLVMPKASGHTLYQAIRAEQGSGKPVKVLFTSGYPAPDFRESLADDPNVAFVTKPWTASELLRQIRGLLER